MDALAARARTPMGAAAVRALDALSVADVRVAFDAVDELRALEAVGGPIPVGAVSDVRETAVRAQKGAVLDDANLRDAGRSLAALRQLANRLREEREAPVLAALGARIDVDPMVALELDQAYDATGQISGSAYPEIGDLRTTIQRLHESVRRTAEELVKGDAYADVLQDRYVTMRDDRYVVPIKAHAKRWNLGIVHGTSGSGATVYVEPAEVVELNNRLRLAEAAYEEACHRVRTQLSAMLGRVADEVVVAVEVVIEIDLACAREGLARALNATRPIVREEGVIDLRDARHPVLLLRGIPVVGNRLRIDTARPALVLTGPNTGGKTVALKTIGLCALLVRWGCFVPAAEGSRVDRFSEVLADIGDAQTVHGDLSSFSAQLVVLRGMLDRAAIAGHGALCLLDEPCSGTDPSQGGALARAVLEALVDRGARVVATTHLTQIKGLAEADGRFRRAAMEYADGRPTYRVIDDVAGESHALDTALRMGLSSHLVERARSLLSESERGLHEALAALDRARTAADADASASRRAEAELRARITSLDAREGELEERKKRLDQAEGSAFVERLRSAEKAIAAIVADLQRAPDSRKAENARQTVQALGMLVPEAALADGSGEFAVGDTVKVKSLGQVGEVVEVSSGTCQVRVRGVVARVRKGDLEPAKRAPRPTAPATRVDAPKRKAANEALRVETNTLDLRGHRVEEALERVDHFIAEARSRGHDVVFLLHGHGTGALKEALRKELHAHPGVMELAPAEADQGGDAFTAVSLR